MRFKKEKKKKNDLTHLIPHHLPSFNVQLSKSMGKQVADVVETTNKERGSDDGGYVVAAMKDLMARIHFHNCERANWERFSVSI